MNDYWFSNDDGRRIDPEDAPLLGCLYGVSAAIVVFVVLLMCLLLGSCKSVKYVPVIEHRTDTIQITKHQRDSIYMKDSTHVSEKQNGDTLWLEVERWHTKYVEKQVHDTMYVATHDTIPDPYPVEVKVEKQLSWWQKFRLSLGNTALIALLGLLVYGGWKLYRRFTFP